MERRLRSHFFFYNMQTKITEFVNSCTDSKTFDDMKTTELLRFHQVPSRNCEIVAVHFFGPVPSSIYNNYGRPKVQISHNRTSLNSRMMNKFSNEKDIELQKILPLHPSLNPTETFMRPLGRTKKVKLMKKLSEKDPLEQLLDNYRDTPHSAT